MTYSDKLVAIKFLDRKHVALLSTAFNCALTDTDKKHWKTNEPVKKLNLVYQYNRYMGCVNCNDQLLKYSAFNRRTLKWWKKVFFHLLNVAMVNAYVLHCEWSKKKFFKCLLQTEYCMAVMKQMTGVDVTAPGSSRRPPVSLEYQRLSGQHFPHKTIVESQKNRISRSCKVCIPPKHEIDRSSNAPKKSKQHEHESSYECAQCMVTLCIDPCFRFYHQHKDYITKCKSWKRQNSNN